MDRFNAVATREKKAQAGRPGLDLDPGLASTAREHAALDRMVCDCQQSWRREFDAQSRDTDYVAVHEICSDRPAAHASRIHFHGPRRSSDCACGDLS